MGKGTPFILGGDLFFLDFGLEEYCEQCMSGSLVHPQKWDGYGCLVDNLFKYNTWLQWDHDNIAYPGCDSSCSSRISSAPQSQLKVFKSYVPSMLLA